MTGTEVLTGRVADRNGPWLAERLRELGVDVGHVVVVGDRPADLRDALAFLAGTGVALVHHLRRAGPHRRRPDRRGGRPSSRGGRSVRDPALEQRIGRIVERLSARRGWHAPTRTPPPRGCASRRMVPAGRHRAGAGRHGAPGSSSRPRTGAAGRRCWCCPGRRPSCRACGRPRSLAEEHAPGARAAPRSCARRRSGSGGRWSPQLAATLRERTSPSWPAWRSPPACGTASWRSSPGTRPRREPAYDRLLAARPGRASTRTLFYSTGPTVDDLVADALRRPRLDRGDGGVVHRRPARGAADSARGLLGVGARRGRRLRQQREGAICSASPRSCWPSAAR